MRKKGYKGRCEKRTVEKCKEICKTYDPIQSAYVDLLTKKDEIKEIRCNVVIECLEIGDYMSDIVCIKTDGDLMIRECVYRKMLTKPKTLKILDASKKYWLRRGVEDWGLVLDAEVNEE